MEDYLKKQRAHKFINRAIIRPGILLNVKELWRWIEDVTEEFETCANTLRVT